MTPVCLHDPRCVSGYQCQLESAEALKRHSPPQQEPVRDKRQDAVKEPAASEGKTSASYLCVHTPPCQNRLQCRTRLEQAEVELARRLSEAWAQDQPPPLVYSGSTLAQPSATHAHQPVPPPNPLHITESGKILDSVDSKIHPRMSLNFMGLDIESIRTRDGHTIYVEELVRKVREENRLAEQENSRARKLGGLFLLLVIVVMGVGLCVAIQYARYLGAG